MLAVKLYSPANKFDQVFISNYASMPAAASRSATTVFGGMILASFIGVLFVPMLVVGFEVLSLRASRLVRRRSAHPAE